LSPAGAREARRIIGAGAVNGENGRAGFAVHLIVTHEQADFDAVAALLAAKLLHEQAIAVLPRRINRNVRAFLTLYRDQMPYVEFRDLPSRGLSRVTLVDRQSLPSLKGLSSRTHVHVIDHHKIDEGLDRGWTSHIEPVGATTTLLIEGLEEAGREPTPVEATMLLLGIYEDTGSLLYKGTTSRDVRACAWLLDHGASLSIAADYLDHPLSDGQRELYERLLESAETLEIHGFTVVIAAERAPDLVDEISSLAHKLRDVFDPTGLFVLVELNGNVQMVARSNSDGLDVGRVAEHFGGGGHSRAAAALIRDKGLQATHDELVELLSQIIRPTVTVGEIMSRGPQLLQPQDTVEEAAERMRRFGHEGYPVVERGNVVGLLSRREVDRAMSHGMGQRPVSAVMDAGDLVVHPSDSVDHLQRVMVEYDWGQVPVVDPEGGEIIGIVTRTDLLKTLAPQELRSASPNLGEKLERALPAARKALLHLVAQSAEERGDALFIVGGFVRDLLLGEASVDFDLVVEGDAIGLARALVNRYGGKVSSHWRFGTAKWALAHDRPELIEGLKVDSQAMCDLPDTLDFVSARTEFYTHPTALPSVRSGSIKLDLHRRDFTINTLALRLDGRHYGQLLDHWGGGQDLEQGLIRALHSLSFVDDPTRALRAVRLEQRMGFEIEARTLELLRQALPLLDRVSGERISSELELVFEEPKYGAIMARLRELGLLSAIHPALDWDEGIKANIERALSFEAPAKWKLSEGPARMQWVYALWFLPMGEDVARALCARFSLPAATREIVLGTFRILSGLRSIRPEARPSQWVQELEGASEKILAVVWLAMGTEESVRQAIDAFLSEWRFVSPEVDGNALREMGLPPGPAYKDILWSLRAAILDGQIRSAEEEHRMALELAARARL
jgi:tRNA nucleotidyltransferase (CCA-adding enzyme)